uniref:Uncharacterized protein n=1 Tax=Oryza sativa subsp. japonica TaxID=39947 RepID=Q6Z249_ORYSJ|nr:hypothetical protein [Oryza sativa Japonica Group]
MVTGPRHRTRVGTAARDQHHHHRRSAPPGTASNARARAAHDPPVSRDVDDNAAPRPRGPASRERGYAWPRSRKPASIVFPVVGPTKFER